MEALLDELCGTLHNWFLVKPDGIHSGEFTIENGNIDCDFLAENQYFRIKGSVFNDGVWKYPATGMDGEIFVGEVWAMAVPPAVTALLTDIESWITKYGGIDSVQNSPFSSESFNNYSYTKATGGDSSTGSTSAPVTWKDIFADRLRRWKKI